MVVTAIHNEMEDEVPVALCGDNVRVRLRGVEDEDILIGFVLTSPQAPVHVVTQFEAQLVILDHKNIICAGYGAVMHVHTLSEEVNLVVRPPAPSPAFRRFPSSSIGLTRCTRRCYITTTKRRARNLVDLPSLPKRVRR